MTAEPSSAISSPISAADRLLTGLDRAPWNALFLGAVGYMVPPTLSALGGDPASAVSLTVFLLLTLFSLRIVFLVLRRILPFSKVVKEVWAKRRALGRTYDSYQWRKMLWVGLGLAAHLLVSEEFPPAQVGLAAACSASGALGLAIWSRKGVVGG